MRRAKIFLAAVIALVGCNRQTEFLYEVKNPKPSEVITVDKKIKEVVQGSTLDILWAIDNSGSMQAHQKNVIANTALFMGALTKRPGVDWKMGLISSAIEDAPYLGFTPTDVLDSHSKDPITKFQNAVGKLGFNRGCPELIVAPTVKHLKANPKFMRPTSFLVLIGVTDTTEDQIAAQNELEAHLKSVMGSTNRFKSYAILPLEATCAHEPYWKYAGSPIEYFINLTKGKTFSLCSPDFGKNLAIIGDEISTIATTSKIFLPSRPLVETIQVFHRGKELKAGSPESGGVWYFDVELNAVLFHDLSFASSETESIRVKYSTDDGRLNEI